MPPPSRSGGGALIAIILGGGLVAVLLIGVVVYVVVSSGGGGKTPEEKLNAAATSLAAARAVALDGSLTGGSDTLQGQVTVTRGGRATGQVRWNSDDLTLLSADGKLFVKADSTYWKREISSTETPYYLGSGPQWGRLNTTELSLDFKQDLTPSAIAAQLRQFTRYNAKPTKTTLKGQKALRFSSATATFYITDADDARLLRYEDTYPRIAVDVTAKDGGDAATAITDFRTRVGELKGSFYGSARPTISEWKKGGCNGTAGCTVEAKVRPPFGADPPLTVDVRFRLTAGTLTGRDLGNCTSTITITGSTPVWARCRVTSNAWSSWAKSSGGTFYKHADYKVEGASSGDIQTLQSGLDSE